MPMLRAISVILCVVSALVYSSPVFSAQFGVFYFPGWSAVAWDPIKSFPERRPLRGFYPQEDKVVARGQIKEMIAAEMDYVVVDYYPNVKGDPERGYVFLDELAHQQEGSGSDRLKFALLLIEHHPKKLIPKDYAGALYAAWGKYFASGNYFSVNGCFNVFVFDPRVLEESFGLAGGGLDDFFEEIESLVRRDFKVGVCWIGGVFDSASSAKVAEDKVRVGGVFGYNFHGDQSGRLSTNFRELHDAYLWHWRRLSRLNKAVTFLPATVGWDRRPWGGSSVPEHDLSVPKTDDDLLLHFSSWMDVLSELESSGRNVHGVICCWNEYGEGSVLEASDGLGDRNIRLFLKAKKSSRFNVRW